MSAPIPNEPSGESCLADGRDEASGLRIATRANPMFPGGRLTNFGAARQQALPLASELQRAGRGPFEVGPMAGEGLIRHPVEPDPEQACPQAVVKAIKVEAG